MISKSSTCKYSTIFKKINDLGMEKIKTRHIYFLFKLNITGF